MDERTINCLRSSAGILSGCPGGVLALGSAGMMSTGQRPGRRRYNRRALNRGAPLSSRSSLSGDHYGSAGTAHLWQIAGGGHADLQPWAFPADDRTIIVR